MIWLFNRKELTVCLNQKQYNKVRDALDAAGIPCQVRVRDRTSPSPFAAGTRERSGSFGQDPAASLTWRIYVRRQDWEAARACLR